MLPKKTCRKPAGADEGRARDFRRPSASLAVQTLPFPGTVFKRHCLLADVVVTPEGPESTLIFFAICGAFAEKRHQLLKIRCQGKQAPGRCNASCWEGNVSRRAVPSQDWPRPAAFRRSRFASSLTPPPAPAVTGRRSSRSKARSPGNSSWHVTAFPKIS